MALAAFNFAQWIVRHAQLRAGNARRFLGLP
jgi:hypothetical protein